MIIMESTVDFIKRKNEQFQNEKARVRTREIGRNARCYYVREAWTFLPQHNLEHDKVFVFERLRMERIEGGEIAFKSSWAEGNIEYRIGYYIRGKIKRAKDKWVWGQYCPLIPHKDLLSLFLKAKTEKVILD